MGSSPDSFFNPSFLLTSPTSAAPMKWTDFTTIRASRSAPAPPATKRAFMSPLSPHPPETDGLCRDKRIKTSRSAEGEFFRWYPRGVRLVPVEDGWLEWDPPAGARARVLVRLEEAPDGRHTLTGLQVLGTVAADVLRAIPVGRIEAAANAGLAEGPRRRTARIPANLRANAVQGYPDRFYDAVAAAYRSLVATSSRPIADLAAANDVALTTAQRWVKEARRRGKLPPGRAGKAG
jgi:hypothetical protein